VFRLRRTPVPSPEFAVTLRYASPDDAVALARLAALDSAVSPASPVLLGEVDGELRAALSLRDGAAIADPFRPTAALIELLVARAKQLQRRERRSRGFAFARSRPREA
jgi:hypothetical protein